MKPEYVYLQPKYVEKFRCDGEKCPANCCERDWRIFIDRETREKYFRAESAERELTKHLEPDEESGDFLLVRDEKNRCPFLTEKKLCGIQLQRGENFLSQTCSSYPRRLFRFGEVIEKSLSPTCPLAAELILNPDTRIEFEFSPVKLPAYAKGILFVGENFVPPELSPHFVEMQVTAISILSERRLTIDKRLTVAGYYFYQAERIFSGGESKLLATLNKVYTSEEFFKDKVPDLISSVQFQILEYVQIIFPVLAELREKNCLTKGNEKYFEFVENAMSTDLDAPEDFNFNDLAESYFDLREIREIFLKNFSGSLENYLVNEFFGNVYPARVPGNFTENFGIFVLSFKILELVAVSMFALSRSDEKFRAEFFKAVYELSADLAHNEKFSEVLNSAVRDKEIALVMRGLLINR